MIKQILVCAVKVLDHRGLHFMLNHTMFVLLQKALLAAAGSFVYHTQKKTLTQKKSQNGPYFE